MKDVNIVGRGQTYHWKINFRELTAVKTQISGTRQKENHNAKATHVIERFNPDGEKNGNDLSYREINPNQIRCKSR